MRQIKLSMKEIAEILAALKKRNFTPALENVFQGLTLDFAYIVAQKRRVSPQELYQNLVNDIQEATQKGL